MKKTLLLAALLAANTAHAQVVYQDSFTGGSIDPIWNEIVGTPVALDNPNDQLDYTHTAGTTRRFLSDGNVMVTKTGYFKAEISNFTGSPSIWIAFVEDSPANNANYASTIVSGNGTYELFFNNNATGSLPFDNGSGWTGNLAAGAGLWTTDGGSTSAALTIGGSVTADIAMSGFGFANFGNAGVFPSSSFSIDSVVAHNTLTPPIGGNTAPNVTITAPTDGITVPSGTNVNFTGTATDTEDGTLDSSILWSSNLDGSIGGPAASINTSTLSIGTHTITASVTDSGSLVGNDSIMVTVTSATNTPPMVVIHTPANRTVVAQGVNLFFTGYAEDLFDGVLSSSIVWSSSVDGAIGTGESVSTSTLSLGAHTITASVTDAGSLVGTDTLTLNVISTSGASRPNVIVIVCDDAGYADFGFMNDPNPADSTIVLSGETSEVPTPHLDALANRGITFSRAYVAANCQPTRAAIVTGAYQARIGNENVGDNHFLSNDIFEGVPLGVDTVWDRMKNLGYTTGAIGKWHLGSIADTASQPGNRPQNQGIDEFYGFWHGSRNYLTASYSNGGVTDPTNPLQLRYIREALILPDGSTTDTIVEYTKFPADTYMTSVFGDYAEQFVADHHADTEPFFLYVAHPAPHKPWTNESPDYNNAAITGLVTARRQVASMMITMDREIGELMTKLDDPLNDGTGPGNDSDSIRDNTLVIFINDNGGVSGGGTNNGVLNGVKGSPHDGGICVPMIMAGAGIPPAMEDTVYDHPVHGIDILPTAVELAGGTLDPVADHIDGVNLIPFLDGTNASPPHDLLVHRWRGTFAVIDDNWKLVNTNNTNANPSNFRIYDLTTDRSEATNIIGSEGPRAEVMKRVLTDHEAIWDKPRYPILNRDLESEPLNIIDHFTFRPGIDNDWSAGVPDSVEVTTQPANWYEGGTTNLENMFRSDGFNGAILEFPVSSTNYISNNDLVRKTGMEFMLNTIILSGDFPTGGDRTATIQGNDLIFTNNLAGTGPQIAVDATESGGFGFTYDVSLNLIMYHDLTIAGDGDAQLNITGNVSEYFDSRGLNKTGSSTAAVNGARTYSGNTTVDGGVLTLGQANGSDETSDVSIAAGATLDLTFGGTDNVDKLFINGVQQAAGVYGNGAGGTPIPEITGTGTLTIASGPPALTGFALWSSENAPGALFDGDHDLDEVQNGIEYFMGESGSAFTSLPSPDSSGTVLWTMGASYSGAYGTDFRVETSPELLVWTEVGIGDVAISPGSSVSYTLPPGFDSLFVRLAVEPE